MAEVTINVTVTCECGFTCRSHASKDGATAAICAAAHAIHCPNTNWHAGAIQDLRVLIEDLNG